MELRTEVDVTDATEPTTSMDVPEKAIMAFCVLRDAIYTTGTLHNADLRDWEELHELKYEASI